MLDGEIFHPYHMWKTVLQNDKKTYFKSPFIPEMYERIVFYCTFFFSIQQNNIVVCWFQKHLCPHGTVIRNVFVHTETSRMTQNATSTPPDL